ncbi:uncharacterized protein LOC135842473 [Planococcus citri]|uniref:uncharacterized protein LOC135842473 n=1 Tax=Planococcus citri TaxID=170843 RepID=UPI0031F72372
MTPKKKEPKKVKKTTNSNTSKASKKTGSKTSKVSKNTKKNSKATKPKAISKSKVSKIALRKKAVLSAEQKTCTAKILRKRPARAPKKEIKSTRGVVYLKNVPHGFYEVEMKKFFSQFGQVTGVRIPKSTRTGKYRGYAFVEFMYPDVAKIAAETMNNYLMYKRVIKAKYLPAEEQKPYAIRFPAFKVPLTVRRKRFLRQRSNQTLTEEQTEKEKKRLNDCVQKKLNKLKKLGINYEFQVANQESTKTEETTA